ncbi:FUSC family protein [Agromyces sp. NPDC057865]|uniref:FUSC family protein n=1 Tax=Agromyces sp. NPDC057865 TaxID=3346267 RepID=UPI00366B9C65
MDSPRPIAWSWRNVAHGVLLALPAVVACVFDPSLGLPLAVGVLPAAALGLRSTRRERALVILVGVVAGASIFLGSVVAGRAVLAVLMVFVLCVVVAAMTADPSRRLAPLMQMLGLPLYGAGLSESSWTGLAAGLLMVAGSVYGWLVSLAWTEGERAPRPPRVSASRTTMLVYGVQIGLAGAAGAALGFAFGVDHPGWACTAALLVSRPDRRQLDARGWGRGASVVLGAVVACTIAAFSASDPVIAVLVLVTLAVGTGTSGSRWYVFPFFSTVLVLSMLLLDETESASHWFLERVGLTLLGVALALVAAWIFTPIRQRVRAASVAAGP